MPTGYTCEIENGMSFEQFALRCARGLAYLTSMQEESLDAPIPDVFE